MVDGRRRAQIGGHAVNTVGEGGASVAGGHLVRHFGFLGSDKSDFFCFRKSTMLLQAIPTIPPCDEVRVRIRSSCYSLQRPRLLLSHTSTPIIC
jgi:hypothetical protein